MQVEVFFLSRIERNGLSQAFGFVSANTLFFPQCRTPSIFLLIKIDASAPEERVSAAGQ